MRRARFAEFILRVIHQGSLSEDIKKTNGFILLYVCPKNDRVAWIVGANARLSRRMERKKRNKLRRSKRKSTRGGIF